MASILSANHDRGRTATRPEQIPAPGWWDIVIRVTNDLGRDNVSLVAGGLAMYALLAVFPALAAAISFYGLLFTPWTTPRKRAYRSSYEPAVAEYVRLRLVRSTPI